MFLKFGNKKIEENIITKIYQKDRIVRYATFLVGLFCVSLAFNIFLLPSEVVYGVSGIAVMLNNLYGVAPSTIILSASVILLILSYFILGKEKTTKTAIGALLYPLFVKLTEPIIPYIDLGTTEPVVIALFGAVISGFGLGLVYKAGFTTGGSDIINQIISKKCNTSIGKAMLITDGIIVSSSVFVFGWQKLIYSIICIYIVSTITDKVILGISKSKAFYIVTEKEEEIKHFILKHLSHGVTVLDARGGYTGNKAKVIMCIIPTKEYFIAKEGIKGIDEKAFFLVTDAYEVSGGE